MSKESKHLYEFGPFRIDPEERLLFRGEEPIPLPPKAFETLLILVDRSERVVLKDDLMKRLWPDTFVEEANLSQNIFVLRKALGDSAQDARYIATVPGRGYRFAQKVRQVGEEEAELVVQSHSIQRVTIEEEKAQTGRRFLWAGLAVLLVGCALGYRFYFRPRISRGAPAPATAPAARRSIAVLGFRNLSGRPEEGWLSTALSEMLSTELAAGEKLRLISGEDIAHAKLDLSLADTGTFSKDTLARMRRNMGSDLVVLGSYTVLTGKSNGSIRLDLRVQNASAGETIAEVAATGREDDLFDLVSQAGARLREKLGVEAVSPADAVSVRASLPDNPEAARLYSQGLAKLRVFDALAARDLLQESVANDPKFPLSHAALAEAWTALGYDAKAKAEATQAFQLSGKLRHEEGLAVEGRYRMAILDYPKAVDVYRTLYTLFPDNLDYGLRLAEAQDFASEKAEAISTLESLQKLSAPLGDDPRIDLRMAGILSESDHEKALAADERVIRKATASGAKLLLARAQGNRCVNFLYNGKLSEGIAACQESQHLYASAGDRNGVGKELNDLGGIQFQKGNMPEAKALWQEAAQTFREIGNDEGVAATLANLAGVVYTQGDLAQAKQLFNEALPKYRKVGDTDGEALLLINFGEVQAYQAELQAAERTYQQALVLTQRANDKHATGYALAGLGDLLLFEGNLAEARKAYEQSLALRNELGEKQTADESRIYLAELTIEEGHPADAEKSAREAVTKFRSEQQADDELVAAAVLVEALLAQGKVAEAKAAADGEADAAAKNQNRTVNIKFAIVAARALAASGKFADAQANLEAQLKSESKQGFLSYQLETRLALAETEIKSGHAETGHAQLRALHSDAQAHGLGLIAQKASLMQR